MSKLNDEAREIMNRLHRTIDYSDYSIVMDALDEKIPTITIKRAISPKKRQRYCGRTEFEIVDELSAKKREKKE